jgi:hypothetical protein
LIIQQEMTRAVLHYIYIHDDLGKLDNNQITKVAAYKNNNTTTEMSGYIGGGLSPSPVVSGEISEGQVMITGPILSPNSLLCSLWAPSQ